MNREPGGDRTMITASGTSKRPALSREQIITSAIRFIDEHGLSALTMRRLAEDLGVEAMSLHRHINGREDLLEGMVAAAAAPRPAATRTCRRVAVLPAMARTWCSFTGAGAPQRLPPDRHPPPRRAVATAAAAQPRRSRRLPRHADLARVQRHPRGDGLRAFSSFLLGHLLLEASLLGAQTSPAEEPLDEGQSDVPNADQDLDLGRFPRVQQLKGLLSEDHAEAEFEQALEDVLDRLDRSIAE